MVQAIDWLLAIERGVMKKVIARYRATFDVVTYIDDADDAEDFTSNIKPGQGEYVEDSFETLSLEVELDVDMVNEPRDEYIVSIPTVEDAWIDIASFDSKIDAVNFAMTRYGADVDGTIQLVSVFPAEKS